MRVEEACGFGKDGAWRTSKANEYVQLGVAHEYYDWSF